MNPKLPVIRDLDLAGKKVLIRGDFDVDSGVNPRADAIRKIVELVRNSGAAGVKVIGHCETEYDLAGELAREYPGVIFDSTLRKDPGEKENSEEYAAKLATGWDVYINEAFATSHRQHCSVDALPRLMKKNGRPVAVGLRFEKEIEVLSGIFNKDGKKILVIGGAKAGDKEKASIDLAPKFDAVLKGGLLTGVKLRGDGMDLADETIENYKKIISDAGLVVVAGPMGKFEDPGSEKGTKEVFTAAAESRAYKVAGGGDTELAINTFGLAAKFDRISVGGGAMLVYLSTGTLPGIEAVL
jgi:3-phosphoglycerate kinase